ncbi:MAG TPA: DUF2092 domain-containing protein [Noviherbaspirillum sp.]
MIAAAVTVPVYSQQSASAGEASVAAAATPSQVQAREILMRMARFLSTAPSFSVSLNTGYDAVQNSGQKIEFDERRKVIISRPDHLHAEAERSDGSKVSVVFTGKEIVLVDPTNNVYATAPQQGGLDESIVYFVSNLGMRLPLAVLLVSQAPAEFEDRVRTIDYVEKTNILGTPSHHLAGRTDTVDFQFWISDGEQPFPQRIVLTYRTEPGQPQFWAQFADWRLSPTISASTFSPQIPAGAQKIAFAAQLSTVSSATRKPPTDKGAK